jgi:hypothetical protein
MFAGLVHAFDRTVGSWMVGLGESMFDSTSKAESLEGMGVEASG